MSLRYGNKWNLAGLMSPLRGAIWSVRGLGLSLRSRLLTRERDCFPLILFALFMVLRRRFPAGGWADWPRPLRDRQPSALQRAQEWGQRIPTGVFFQDQGQPPFSALLQQLQPTYARCPPAQQPVCDSTGAPQVDIEPLLVPFRVRPAD